MSAIATAAQRLGRLGGSSYVKAIAVLSSGQTLAALLPLAAAPILGRLYAPSDYGALATYMAIANLFGAVSTLQLQLGVIAERSTQRAADLVAVAIVVAAGFAVAAGVVGIAVSAAVSGSAAYGGVSAWMLLLPATVLSAGTTAAIASLANRMASYESLARIPVIAAAVTVGSSILLGLMGWGAHGLFASYFCGQALGFAAYLRLYRSLKAPPSTWHPARLFPLGWRHRDYARYSMPSQIMGVMSLDVPVYALTATGNASLLGALQRARALVSMPMSLAGGAVAQVFRQRASEDFRRTGSCRRIYVRTALGLLAAGIPPMAFLTAFAPDLFVLVLGPNWEEAGTVTRILVPALLLQLVCSPVSTVFYFLDRQREDFLLSIGSIVVVASSTLLMMTLWDSRYAVPVAYSAAMSVVYLIYIVRGWMIVAQSERGVGA